MNLLNVFKKLDRLYNKTERKNSSSSEAESLRESIYTYSGPVYRFGKLYSKKVSLSTNAVSKKKALNNICYRLKKEFGFLPSANLELDPSYLYIEEESNLSSDNLSMTDTKIFDRPKCKICGYLINDAGECPVCDLGETDLL